MLNQIPKLLRGAMPHALHDYLYVTRPARERARAEAARLAHPLQLAARNADLRDRHAGERCFILCNGPSVKLQDITCLQGEKVFSVSSGYHHRDYALIRPLYHCVPQITYGVMTREDVVRWFREMDTRLGSATLFLNHTEEALVRDEGLFAGREVRYTVFSGDLAAYPGNAKPDITGCIPGVQSVPLMCIMIAMYMGFRRIYLLGTDHDSFRTGDYKYFYEPTVLKGKDFSTTSDGAVTSLFDELTGLATLWRQYRRIKEIAASSGVEIVNATAGGALDEFPRIDLRELFRPEAGGAEPRR